VDRFVYSQKDLLKKKEIASWLILFVLIGINLQPIFFSGNED